MVSISNVSDETSVREATSKKEDHHLLFLPLLNHLQTNSYIFSSHSNFLNTILTIMWFQFKIITSLYKLVWLMKKNCMTKVVKKALLIHCFIILWVLLCTYNKSCEVGQTSLLFYVYQDLIYFALWLMLGL